MQQKKTDLPPLKVAIYIRVSSAEQAKYGDSMRDQLESGQEYIKSHENMILQDVYTDDGISGQKLDRDGFNRLLEMVKADQIDLIIFTKIDRWFRSLRHYLNTQAILEEHHVNWLAIQQPYFDTSSPHGRAFIAQSMMWAELEAQNDSIRILDVFANKSKYGEVLSGKSPRGYSIVNKHLQPNDEAPMILDLFYQYRDSGSLYHTLNYLKTEYNVVMSHQNLKNSILTNKKYIGIFRDNHAYCPPLVPEDLFNEVQNLLSKNIKASQKYTYLFSGLIVCAECRRKFSSRHINVLSKGIYRYHYPSYICDKYRRYKTCPNGGEVRESKIEEYMLANIVGEIRRHIAQYELESPPVKDNRAKRSSIQKKITKLKELYLNDCISLEEYKKDLADLQALLLQLPEKAEPPKNNMKEILEALNRDFEILYKEMNNLEKRQFWRAFVKEIRISKSENRQRSFEIIFL